MPSKKLIKNRMEIAEKEMGGIDFRFVNYTPTGNAYYTCKESFVYTTAENNLTFHFHFCDEDDVEAFKHILTTCSEQLKIKKPEFFCLGNSVYIISRFWKSNIVHLDFLACVAKSVAYLSSDECLKCKTIKDFFKLGPNYFSKAKMQEIFLDIHNAVAIYGFTGLDKKNSFKRMFSHQKDKLGRNVYINGLISLTTFLFE